jgi:hypothetical protein
MPITSSSFTVYFAVGAPSSDHSGGNPMRAQIAAEPGREVVSVPSLRHRRRDRERVALDDIARD